MKNQLLLTLILLLFFGASATLAAQDKEINEKCSGDIECISGHCVTVKDPSGGTKKVCSDCNQSELGRYSTKVNQYCKTRGWTFKTSREYAEAKAADGRVRAGVFDEQLEIAKSCKAARSAREKACFQGGDNTHAGNIRDVDKSMTTIKNEKSRAIRERRVYHCATNTYESKLNTFKAKCTRSDFTSVDGKLDVMERDIKAKKKVDCDDLEDYRDICKKCLDTAKDFIRTAFMNNSSKFPADYAKALELADDNYTRAKILLDDTDDDDLCE